MGQVRILPDRVVNQIAAGEVVERPAAVVKELLENSLDAGARRLRIEIEAGGRKRIEVLDDGAGMTRDDALLALERHATSKLRETSDLLAIPTLGFRGEALPSIASVSRLTLESAPETGGGTRLEIRGGKLQNVAEAGLPRGTRVRVEDLFGNVPARRKFLKTEATEFSHIAGVVTHYALAYPENHFELWHNGRLWLQAAAAGSLAERLQQIFGAELLEQLLEVQTSIRMPREADDEDADAETASAQARDEAEDGPTGPALVLYGFISRPELQKLNRNSLYTFVNRRLVRDRVVQHGISDAYRNLLPNGASPVALLFLDLPYAAVDVNVHPQKVEVRFRRPNWVHDAVRDSLSQVLGVARPVPSFQREIHAQPTARPALETRYSGKANDPYAGAGWRGSSALAAGGEVLGGLSLEDLAPEYRLTQPLPPPVPGRLPLAWEQAPFDPLAGTSAIAIREGVAAVAGGEAQVYAPEPSRGCLPSAPTPAMPEAAWDLSSLTPLGQLRQSYILAAGAQGFCLVDQHAAHERVLFEQTAAARAQGQTLSQTLLLPVVVELNPAQWARYEEIAAEMDRNGFAAEPFGGRSLRVLSVPAGVEGPRAQALLEEILEVSEAGDRRLSAQTLELRIAATIACHAAIKVNMALSPEKMSWLLSALAATRHPMTCPHGRPVLLRYSLREIEQAFKRI